MSFYNEYKYEVPYEQLTYVINTLMALYGNSDPFPYGIVDSIYYDTIARDLYHQCLDGNNAKTKFRIRGYGNDTFNQIHIKEKDLFVVKKLKSKIIPLSMLGGLSPDWRNIQALETNDTFNSILSLATGFGELYPSIRVKYERHRFRVYDYRITLDSHIEVSSFANGLHSTAAFHVIPYNVLEVKTIDPRPHLPLLGLTRLKQISFSKFFLGLTSLIEPGVA